MPLSPRPLRLLLLLLGFLQATGRAESYQSHQREQAYQAWRDKAFSATSPSSSSSSSSGSFYRPAPTKSYTYDWAAAQRQAEYEAKKKPKRTGDIAADFEAMRRWEKANGITWPETPAPAPKPRPYNPRDNIARDDAIAGNPAAMEVYGGHLINHGTTPEMREEGWVFLEKAAAQNELWSMCQCLNEYFSKRRVPKDPAVIRRWLLASPHSSYRYMLLLAAKELLFGLTGPANPALGETYFRELAEDKDNDAEHATASFEGGLILAKAYLDGLGLPKDEEKAKKILQTMMEHPPSPHYPKGQVAHLLAPLLMRTKEEAHENQQELKELWQQTVFLGGDHSAQYALTAGRAIESGEVGPGERYTAALYYSVAAAPDSDLGDPQTLAEVRSHLADMLLDVFSSSDRDVRIGGKNVRPPKDYIFSQYLQAAKGAPQPWAHPFLMAAYLARGAGGDMTTTDPKLAYALFTEAIDKTDDSTAWYETGCMLLSGWGVEADPRVASRHFEKAWAKGDVRAVCSLAQMHFEKQLPDASPATARKLVNDIAAKNLRVVANMGRSLLNAAPADEAGASTKREIALEWLTAAAEKFDAQASYDLGQLAVQEAAGDPAKFAVAAKYFQQAITGGYGAAKESLAELLAEGRGIAQNQTAAMALLREREIVDLSHEFAGRLGYVLWSGAWGEKNVEEGLAIMKQASDSGNWSAGRQLARIHHLGLGVDKDETAARRFLNEAGLAHLDPDREKAKANASEYRKGEVVDIDLTAAKRWDDVEAEALKEEAIATRRDLVAATADPATYPFLLSTPRPQM